MKTAKNLVLIFSVVLICTACGKDKDKDNDKSSACDIITFTTGSDNWQISGNSITISFPKGTSQGSLTPVITISEKAVVSPLSGAPQDFFTANGVTYTVTAEDGKTKKTYTAKATVILP